MHKSQYLITKIAQMKKREEQELAILDTHKVSKHADALESQDEDLAGLPEGNRRGLVHQDD